MEAILRKVKKWIPRKAYRFFQPFYHYCLAYLGAVRYGFPSRKLIVIGVTGTKGKSSTVEIVNAILEKAGFTTALSNTIRFKIAGTSRPNTYKMSMPGRSFIQKFLHDAVAAGCTHAIIEVTSEGAKQHRDKFIDFDALVLTNLSPEHIESHGSYENYRAAKIGILKQIEKSSKTKTLLVINGDDPEAPHFTDIHAHVQYIYSLGEVEAYHEDEEGIKFLYKKQLFTSPLLGRFNAYNIFTAMKIAQYLKIDLDIVHDAIKEFGEIPGRAERIDNNRGIEAIVDYAHTPDSLEALYKAFSFAKAKVCVLGNTGGGRDTWKRPEMGRIADQYCDHIILTNEDPYDENPEEIVYEMKAAIVKKPCDVIMDRRAAIARALSLAKEGDAVLITGKGTDPYIMGPDGEKTPWSDAKVVAEELAKLGKKK